VSDYQFGREVTIKLPEPGLPEKPTKEWYGDRWLVTGTHIPKDRRYITVDTLGNVLYPDEARELAAALLAAADYAENGDQE